METECVASKFSYIQSLILRLRCELKECRAQVSQLNTLQQDFSSDIGTVLSRIMEQSLEKENVQKFPQCLVTLADSETQTVEAVPRRWNSDLSLDSEVKSNSNRLPVDDSLYFVSSETVAAPVIRTTAQRKTSLKSKFTNRLEIINYPTKRPGDNLLLSDLGLTSQAPEFSQSEFNLSSEDHWENQKSGGRVRFLSHDDGQSVLKPRILEGNEVVDFPQRSGKLSYSGSWATLTHSERDLSELDSTFSLNVPESITDAKLITSTPCKGLRSKLKQSVSFNDLLPSKTTQSLPNLEKPLDGCAVESLEPHSCSRSGVPAATSVDSTSSKRHSMTMVELRAHSNTTHRRSSLTGNMENGPYVPSTVSSLYLGGRVKALHGGHLVVTGTVWYRGKLPGIADEIVGIEIDQVGLGGDGTFQGHRYFRCAPGRGLFVPFRKIIMAWPPHVQ